MKLSHITKVNGLLLLVLPAVSFAHSAGPPPRVTAAPGDHAEACTLCHSGSLNPAGGGKVEIILPNGAFYTPAVKQHLMVHVSDPAQKRWGFEMSARLNSDLANGQAGDLTPTDGNTQAFCDDGSPKPCSSPSVIQFISHTLSGTRNGTSGGAVFEFDWTPPATDVGGVTLYVAGNAANGNGSPTGDHIYTANIQLAPRTSAVPTIAKDGVVNAGSFQTTVALNSWITIFGSNLATGTRLWTDTDIHDGNLPTSLDGTSVTVNGKPAYVEFISPGQVNVLAPEDSSSGPVQVEITSPSGATASLATQLQPISPGFFLFDGKYLAAGHADGTPVAKAGSFGSTSKPAQPGEMVVLYGTGFGPTDPAAPAGQVVAQLSKMVTPPQMTVGGIPATVSFAGLIPGFAGLFQFNVQLPAALADGDQKVIAQIGGTSSPDTSACCFITVQHQ